MTTNIKELLKKYEEHTATQEEIDYITEKLEEFNLLQEQLLKEDFDLETLSTDLPEIDTKQLKKQVNKKIRNLILLVFTGVISLFLIFQFAVTPVLNQFYFNPMDKEKTSHIPTFNLVSSVYTELTQPTLRLGYVTNKKTGIGTYEIEKGYTSLLSTDTHRAYENPSITYTIKRNKVIENTENNLNYQMNPIWHYDKNRDPDFHQQFKDKKIQKMKELPKSSGLDVALSFKEPLTIEETLAFLETEGLPGDSNYQLHWFSVENKNINIGFDWFGTFPILSEYIGTNDAYLLSLNKKYPNLFPGASRSQDISNISQSLENHFSSALSFMIDHEELLEKQETQYSTVILKEVLKETEKKGVKINGVYLSGTPKGITHLAEKEEVINIDVIGTELFSTFFNDD